MKVYPSSMDPERKFEEHYHHHHHDHEGHFPTRWMVSIPDCPGPLVIQNILSRLSKISVWLHFVWFLFSLCFQFLNALVRALHIRRLHAAICFCTPLRSPSYALLCARALVWLFCLCTCCVYTTIVCAVIYARNSRVCSLLRACTSVADVFLRARCFAIAPISWEQRSGRSDLSEIGLLPVFLPMLCRKIFLQLFSVKDEPCKKRSF